MEGAAVTGRRRGALRSCLETVRRPLARGLNMSARNVFIAGAELGGWAFTANAIMVSCVRARFFATCTAACHGLGVLPWIQLRSTCACGVVCGLLDAFTWDARVSRRVGVAISRNGYASLGFAYNCSTAQDEWGGRGVAVLAALY